MRGITRTIQDLLDNGAELEWTDLLHMKENVPHMLEEVEDILLHILFCQIFIAESLVKTDFYNDV